LKPKLNPYHNKPPHLHCLPKIQKPDTPLRPTVTSLPIWLVFSIRY
jgi:hypothetical protein